MKKILCIVMALAMTLAIGIPAFAVNTESGTTTITTQADETFIVSIPASATIAFEALTTDIGDLALTDARLLPNHVVRITAIPGALDNDADAATMIAYTLNGGDLSYDLATKDATQELSVAVALDTWDAAPAGTYNGTISFTIASVAAA